MQLSALILIKTILHMRVKFVENFLKMMIIHMLATAFNNGVENDIHINYDKENIFSFSLACTQEIQGY